MTKTTHKKILAITTAFLLAFVPSAASADSFLTVSGLPFNATNLYPGASASGSFTIENITGVEQTAQIESINGADPDSLGSQIDFVIKEGSDTLYSGSLAHFMTTGIQTLSDISAGDSKTYDLSITLRNDAPSSYMGTSLGFDFCVGFEGDAFEHCGPGLVGPEQPTNPSGPSTPTSGGGGGGGGGQSSTLIIFDEDSIINVPFVDAATIIWKTNKLATSQVIYGPVAGAPYTLDVNNPPGMGYPSWTVEDSTKKINHSVPLTDLAPGTYVYRVVSHASPATVSPQYTFTIVDNGALAQNTQVGAVQGAQTEQGQVPSEEADNASSTEEVADELFGDPVTQAAAAVLSGDFPGLACIGFAILIFLIILGAVTIASRKKDHSFARDVAIIVIGATLATIILGFIPYICPIIPLWIIVLAYAIWKFIQKKRRSTKSN